MTSLSSTLTCSVVECDKPYHCRGWCKKHYQRWQQRGGDPSVARRAPNGSGHVDISTGYRTRSVGGHNVYEHRLAMEELLGIELPSDWHVHHRNENKLDNRAYENLSIMSASGHLTLHKNKEIRR